MCKISHVSFLSSLFLLFGLTSGQAKDSEFLFEINPQNASSVVEYLREEAGVSVINFTGNYDKEIAGTLNIEARQAVTQELFQHQPDQYDFVVIFTTFPVDAGENNAFAIAYENDVQGIGRPLFDNSDLMGSQRLQASIDMLSISNWELNPGNRRYDITLDALMHEMMHRWGVYVSFQDGNNDTSDLLRGRDDVHWNYFLNSNASLMYGSLWEDLGAGAFMARDGSKGLSPLDLYLMGFIDQSAVPDFYLIDSGTPGDRGDIPAPIGTQVKGTRTDVSIEDIIAVEGVRQPLAEDSQHEFNFKFVLLKAPSDDVNADDIGSLVVLQREFQKRFFAETAGIGEIVYPTPDSYHENANPETLDYVGDNTTTINLLFAENFLSSEFSENDINWADKAATRVRDTAMAIGAMNYFGRELVVAAASEWLNSIVLDTNNIDELAWLLLSDSLTAENKAFVSAYLLQHVNSDGGWGMSSGSESSAIDTALVIWALRKSMGDAYQPSSETLLYLHNQINPDGGIGYASGGKSSLSSSAMMLMTFFELTENSTIEQGLIDFIISQQNPDGGFGDGQSTVHETALIINALNAASNQDHTAETALALAKLDTMQSLDGSFQGSVYSTALAVQVLVSDQRPNLTVQNVQLSNDYAVAGEQLSLSFEVGNLGLLDADNVTIALLSNELVIVSDVFSTVDSEEFILSRFDIDTTSMSGVLNLTLFVDHENAVFESNEADNQQSLMLEVIDQSSTPELAFDYSTISVSPDYFDALPFDINATFDVSNLSTVDLTGVSVSLVKTVDEFTQIELHRLTQDILAGQNLTYDFNVEITAADGDLDFALLLDPDNEITEVNEENNDYLIHLNRELAIDVALLSDQISASNSVVQGVREDVVFAVVNSGSVDVAPFVAKVYLTHQTAEDVVLYENEIPTLRGGQSVERTFSWLPENIGSYELKFTIDEADVIPEVNESNNEVVIPITINPNTVTNLSVQQSSIILTPDPGLDGLPLSISTDVSNDSEVLGPDFYISLSYQYPEQPAVLIEKQNIQGIAANSSATVTWNIDPLEISGEVTFIVQVDPDNTIIEFNEDDNILLREQVRLYGKADAYISSPSVSLLPTVPVPGQPLSVTVAVSNLGEQDISSIAVRLYTINEANGHEDFVAENQLTQLLAGNVLNTQFDFTLTDLIEIKAIKITVDEVDQVLESNEFNNEALVDFELQNSEFYLTEQFISPDGNGIKDDTKIVFDLAEIDDYRIEIFNPYGQSVYTFNESLTANVREAELVWNGRNDQNEIVKDGVYDVRIDGLVSGYSNYLQVIVDTNRTGFLTSMSEGKGIFYDLGCLVKSIWTFKFSSDGKFIYTDRYNDTNNVLFRGFFKIKTDGSSVAPVFSYQFMEHRTVNYFDFVSSSELIIAFGHNFLGSQLYKFNINTGDLQQLLSAPLDAFLIESYGDESVVVRSNDSNHEGYFEVFYDGTTPAVRIDAAVPLYNFNEFFEVENGWLFKVRMADYSRYQYHYVNKNDLATSHLLVDQQNPENYIRHEISQDKSTFYIKGEDSLIWYRSEDDEAVEIKSFPIPGDSITDLNPLLSEYNELVVFKDGEIQLWDESGYLKLNHLNGIDIDFFKNLLIDEFGSLDSLIFNNGKTDDYLYSFSELFDISIKPRVNDHYSWVSETELYISFEPYLTALLTVDEFGSTNDYDVSIYVPESIHIKIDYSDLSAVRVTYLENLENVDNEFLEPHGFHFLADDQIYLKGVDGEPVGTDLNKPSDFTSDFIFFYRFPLKEDTGSIIKKYKLAPYSLNNPLKCSQVGDSTETVYQPITNLTAFVNTQYIEDKVKISGSAFDENFSHYRIEYKRVLLNEASWNVIQTSDVQRFDEEIMSWAPVEAGAYQVRLTAYDQAGNFTQDTDEVFVTQSNVSYRNVQVQPEIFSPNGDGVKDQLFIDYDVLATTDVNIQIINEAGTPVKTYSRQYVGSGSHEQLIWDGLDDQGQPVDSGEYQVILPGYDFQIILDIDAPVVEISTRTLFDSDDGLIHGMGKYQGFEGNSWERLAITPGSDENNEIQLLVPEFEFYDELSGTWVESLREDLIQLTPFNRAEILAKDYRIIVQDFAGNVGVSEVFNYELDTLYLGRLLKVNEQGTDFNSVLVTVCSTESNELDCEDVYRTFSERVNPNIFNDDFNSEAAFLIQTLSDEVVTGVDLKFSYLSYAAQHDIENQIVAAEIMDFEQAQNYFTTRERLSNEGLPPGMIKFRSNETDIYAYMILIDQDRLLKPHEFVSTPVDQIAVRAEFIDYHRENYFSLAFHFLTEGQFEWFGRVDNDFNSDYYPDFIQDQDFREKFDAMEEVVFNSGLEIYDAHYWFYSSTNRNPYDSGSIKIKFNDPDLDPVSLSPIYEDYPSDGSVSQLFGVNVENCIGIDKVTFSYEGSEFSAAGVGNGLCLLEDGSYQKFQTQSYCEPLAAQDDLIRLVIGGLFNGANTELASIEVFEVIDGVENIFYTNTNPVATPNEDEEDAVLYIDEFQMDKADFLEGEYDFFVRFSDVEGNQFIYSGSYIVQHENVTPQIIEPQELTKYCATGDEEGDIEIPTNIYLNSNSAYFGSVLNSNNNQYILANDEVFNYDDFESKFSLNNGFSGSLKFDMPYFKGLVSLVFETTNTTGVSSCDVVNIEVDSLLDVVVTDKTIEGDLYTQYIPTYVSDLVADEYSHILTNENIEVKVDLYEADGNTLSTHLELLDTFSGSAGQEFSLVWNGQIAGVDAPDGQYFIQLTITDECGLVRYTKNKLIVDRTAPMLNFIQPLDGATVSSLVEVIAGVSDINYEDSSLEFEVNGVWTEINAEVSTVVGGTDKEVTASWLLTELNTGAYPLRITASDKANNESSLTITVNLGESQNLFWNFALSPSYISPNSDAIQDAALITFGLNLNAFVSLHVEDDNQTIIKQLVSNATYDQGSHELFWNGQNDLDQVVTDGVYQVVITASEIGNPGNSQQLSYSLVSDVTLPTVGIDPEGDVIKGEGLMALAVQEANLAQLKAWINRVDSTDPDTLILETNNTGNLNILDLSELSEDDFRLKIEAIDRAGNQLVRLHQFEIDNTKPEVLLINPEIDSFQGGESASIDINGVIIEENFEQYQLFISPDVEPRQWDLLFTGDTLNETAFMENWPVSEDDGVYLIRALAVDQAGWESEVEHRIVIDTQAPEIVITHPLQNSSQGQVIDVLGTINDVNLSFYHLSYQADNQQDDDWQLLKSDVEPVLASSIHLWNHGLDSGDYKLRVFAQDQMGLQSTVVVEFEIDGVAPATPLFLAADLINREDVHLNWQASTSADVIGYNLYRNNQLLNDTLINATSFQDIGLFEDEFLYWVVAVDAVGNVSDPSNTERVIVDRSGPDVSIQNPPHLQVVSGVIDVYGTAYSSDDFSNFKLFVRAQSDSVPGTLLSQSSLPVQGQKLAEIDTTAMTEGANYIIRLEAMDTSDNLSVVEHTVVIDNTAPAAPLNLVHQINGINDVQLNWSANGEADLAGYLVYRNGAIISGTGTIATSIIVDTDFLDVAVVDGQHSYFVVAIDHANNISLPSNIVQADIDTGPPNAIITQPSDGHEFENTLRVVAESDDIDIASILFEYSTDGLVWNTVTTDQVAPYEMLFSGSDLGLNYGIIQLRATATDTAAQTDPSPDQISVEYTDLTPPDAITGLTAQVLGADIHLNWLANVESDLAGYLVSRKRVEPDPEAEFTQISTGVIPANNYVDIGLADGTYVYRIMAVDGFDNSSAGVDSAELTVFSIELTQPYSPLLTPSATDISGMTLQSGDIHADIVNDLGTTSLGIFAINPDGTFLLNDINLAAGDNQITAYQQTIEGHQSKVSAVSTQLSPQPATPINPSTLANGFDVDFSWEAGDLETFAYLPYINGVAVYEEQRYTENLSVLTSSSTSQSSRIVDDNLSTVWVPSYSDRYDGIPVFAQISFQQPKWLTQVTINWDEGYYGEGDVSEPHSYLLQYLTPVGWITLEDFSGNPNAQVTFESTIPYLTDSIRIWMPLGEDGGSRIGLSEVQIWHQPITDQLNYNTSLVDGHYDFQVSAINNYGFESGLTAVQSETLGDVIPPDAVTLQGEVQNGNSTSMSWTASASVDVNNYRLFRNNTMVLNTIDANTLTHIDAGLANGDYAYQVAAVDSAGNSSELSNTVNLTINQQILAAPTGLTIEVISTGGSLQLDWNLHPSPDWSSFKIYRSLDPSSGFEYLAETIENTWLDSNLMNGSRYHYYITAIDSVGNESLASNEVSAVPYDSIIPAQPVITLPTTAGDPIVVNELSVDVSGNTSPGVEVELYHDGVYQLTTTSSTTFVKSEIEINKYIEQPKYNRANSRVAMMDYDINKPLIVSPNPLQITEVDANNSRDYFWHRDGSKLYVIDGYGSQTSLSSFDYSGQQIEELFQGMNVSVARISDDESQLFYWGEGVNPDNSQTEYGLWLLNLITLEYLKLDIVGSVELNRYSIQWLNDNQIAFINYPNGIYSPGELWLYDIQLNMLQSIDNNTYSNTTLNSLVDGSHLFYEVEQNGNKAVRRYDLVNQSFNLLFIDGVSLSNPLVNENPDLVFVNLDCCDEALMDVSSNEVIGLIENAGYQAKGVWLSDGRVLFGNNDQLEYISQPGTFTFNNRILNPGLNEFYAIAKKSNGVASTPSESIAVTLSAEVLPDLEIRESYLQIVPSEVLIGHSTAGSVIVRNISQVDVENARLLIELINPQLQTVAISPSPLTVSLAAGDGFVQDFAIHNLDSTGEYTVRVTIDSNSEVVESNEHNNSTFKVIQVIDDAQPDLSLLLDANEVYPRQAISGFMQVYNPGVAFNGSVNVKLIDTQGFAVGIEDNYSVVDLSQSSSWTQPFNWNSTDVFAGNYQVEASLYDQNHLLVEQQVKALEIKESAEFQLQLSTSSAQVQINQVINFNAEVTYQVGNTLQSGVLTWQVFDDSQQLIWSDMQNLSTMSPGFRATIENPWISSQTGSFELRATLTTPLAEVSGTLPFEVIPQTPQLNLNGTIEPLAAGIILGQNWNSEYTVSNPGQVDVSTIPVKIALWDNDLSGLLFEQNTSVSLISGTQAHMDANWTSDTLDLANYVLVLTADLSGIGGSAETLLDTLVVETVDLTAPEIIINGPINAAYYQSNVELMATVTDQHSSVSQLDVYLDNDFVVTLPGDQLNGIHQHWLTGLSEGQHTINVVATDIYQNSSSQSVTFNVDNTAPQIDVTGVIDAGLYNSTVQPVIHITDANLSQSQITLDGVLFNSGDMVSIEGNHLILVSATDLAGNLATKRVAFNLDLTAPVVVITYPVNGSETNQDTTIVSGQTEVDATVSIMAGAYQDSTVADFEGGFSFADVPLSSGENIISVAATDLAGNAGLESQVTVTYVDTVNVNGSISADLTHPIGQNLSINWSVNNENNFNELGLPVAVTMYRVSDNALLRTDTQSIDLDPVATFNGNTIFVTDDLSAGDYRLQLSAEIDGIMQNLDDHLLTLQDVIGPDLIVFEPTSGQVSTAALEVLAQAVDLHSEIDEVSYQLDNSGTWLPLSWNGSQYSVLLNLLHGDHLIVVRAIDIHGNESTSAEIDFIIDTLAPEIVINSPTDGLITNQPVTIAYTVTDDNNYSDSAELNLNAVSDGDLITAEGDYELTVNALDEVNNESNATHQFIIDTTAPVVVVDHPLDGHQNTSGMIDVSGSSEPRNAIVITVNGIERNMKTDDNGMFTSQDHALQIGNNEIVVTATDQAGNVSLPVLRNVIYSQVGSVIGRVWEDANSDAIIDIGETGFNQILVELTDVDNNTSQVFTDINGYFEFSDLSPGDYNIEVSDGELLTQWINTTNNNPQTISVNADLSTVIDFGFYQDKPILDAEVTANNLKGRLLVLVDTPTAQVDFGQCVGVSSWKMQKNVAHDFSSGDVIWAKLLNAQGTLLQTESASYEEFAANGFQVIDDEAETNEYNLVLQTMDNSHMRAFVNSSSLANPSILSEPYQLILGHQIDGISTEYSSDLVVHDCSTYNQIGNQSGELQLFSVGLNPALASDDANSSSQAQHLVSQQLLLEGMLDDSGWSYHITSDSVEFANQMATGAYVSYWLIAENVKLSSTLQSDLMAEMNEGASLVVSSGQANLNESFYSTLGVHVDGIHADANFIELSDSLISNRVDLPILLDEPVLKASLMGAESVGVFTGSGITAPENIALTWSDDLAGIGVFSGIDWLLQASEELGLSQYTQLMKDVLEFVHPLGLSTQLGRARAVQFEMLNNGRNVDGYVHVKLPVGVSLAYAPVVVSTTPEGFTFEYELLENQSLSHEFWLTVSSSPVTVNFDIHLDEETEVFESLGITLIAGELPDLQASITNCVAGVKPEQSLIYEMTITNTGNKVINGAIAHAEFSSGLTEPNWTCIGVNGGVCLDLSGTGDLIGGVVNLPLDSSVVYRFETDAMISPVTAIQSIGSVQMPVGITDVNPANNDTIDVDSVYQYIFKHSFDCAAAGTGVTQNKSSVLTMEGH